MTSKTVLIVEDERITALDLQEQVKQMGHLVGATVASGEEAIEVAANLKPDLVLMDLKLSGALDGVEASRLLQDRRPVPVVYLTAYPTTFLTNPASMQEPRLCLSKPFSRDALATTFDVIFGRSRSLPC